MNSILSLSLPLTYRQLFKESSPFSNPQWRKISLIAAAVFACFLVCYYVINHCLFKAKPLNLDDDLKENEDQNFNDYAPNQLNHCPLMQLTFIPMILHLVPNVPKAPLFEIEIEELKDPLTSPHFCIENYHVNQGIIEFLVDYTSTGNPEIQALWDEKNKRIYLAGGRSDPAIKIGLSSYRFADHHKAWIRLDLNTLPEKGEIPIYIKEPAICAGPHYTKISEAKETFLIQVSNK